jgi:undecaprenyl-diphosphatase
VTAIWAGAAVAALAFNERYSRVYLGMHWTTDVLSGWFYGILLLALFILATRVIMGPARAPEEIAASDPEAAYPAASNGAQSDAARVSQ